VNDDLFLKKVRSLSLIILCRINNNYSYGNNSIKKFLKGISEYRQNYQLISLNSRPILPLVLSFSYFPSFQTFHYNSHKVSFNSLPILYPALIPALCRSSDPDVDSGVEVDGNNPTMRKITPRFHDIVGMHVEVRVVHFHLHLAFSAKNLGPR